MESLLAKLNVRIETFQMEARDAVKGNKAAGVRSRKLSLQVADLLKEWRKLSVDQTK